MIKKRIWEIVDTFDCPQEQKNELFERLYETLRNKQIIRRGDKLELPRERAVENLEKIAPLLQEDDLKILLSSPDKFYKKFIFSERGPYTSIYLELENDFKSKEDVIIDVCADYLCSPLEKITRNKAEEIIMEIEAYFY